MKVLTTILEIIAIVLNTIFLAGILVVVTRLGANPQTLGDWAGLILMFTFPPVTVVTIALTFQKKVQILTAVLRIATIIVNASFLIILICEMAAGRVNLEGLAQWLLALLGFALPVVNVLAVVLTFRKGEPISAAQRAR